MADDLTDTSSTPDGQGSNQSEGSGAGTQTAPKAEERTFTQKDVDEIVKSRLAKERAKFEKDVDARLAAAKSDYEKEFKTLVGDRVTAALAERDLADAKRAIQIEYGLTDAQLTRLSGDTSEALRQDAELVFGALKHGKKPPVINPGTQPPPAGDSLDLSSMTPAQIREKSAELLKQGIRPKP